MRWASARFWRPFKPFATLDFRPARGDFGARLAGPIWSLAAGCQEDMLADHQVHDLTPEDVSKGIEEGRYLLVDVREPNEVAVEAYPDCVVVPLQSFDPAAIPDPQGKQVVFACRSGKRSVTASLAAQAAGLPYDKHLAGGILGWKAAGLPTRTGG